MLINALGPHRHIFWHGDFVVVSPFYFPRLFAHARKLKRALLQIQSAVTSENAQWTRDPAAELPRPIIIITTSYNPEGICSAFQAPFLLGG